MWQAQGGCCVRGEFTSKVLTVPRWCWWRDDAVVADADADARAWGRTGARLAGQAPHVYSPAWTLRIPATQRRFLLGVLAIGLNGKHRREKCVNHGRRLADLWCAQAARAAPPLHSCSGSTPGKVGKVEARPPEARRCSCYCCMVVGPA